MLVRSPGHVSSIVDKVSACCPNSCDPPRLHSLLLLLAQPSQVPSPPPHTLVSPRIPLHPSHPRATHGPGPRLLRGATPTVGVGDAPHSLGVRCHPARQQVQRWPGAQPPIKGPCPLANSGLPSAPERRAPVAWAPKGRLQRRLMMAPVPQSPIPPFCRTSWSDPPEPGYTTALRNTCLLLAYYLLTAEYT